VGSIGCLLDIKPEKEAYLDFFSLLWSQTYKNDALRAFSMATGIMKKYCEHNPNKPPFSVFLPDRSLLDPRKQLVDQEEVIASY
jgi:hypothetical protein